MSSTFSETSGRPVEVLLVEDNEGDVRLKREALKEGKVRNVLNVASDGIEAWNLFSERESILMQFDQTLFCST